MNTKFLYSKKDNSEITVVQLFKYIKWHLGGIMQTTGPGKIFYLSLSLTKDRNKTDYKYHFAATISATLNPLFCLAVQAFCDALGFGDVSA